MAGMGAWLDMGRPVRFHYIILHTVIIIFLNTIFDIIFLLAGGSARKGTHGFTKQAALDMGMDEPAMNRGMRRRGRYY